MAARRRERVTRPAEPERTETEMVDAEEVLEKTHARLVRGRIYKQHWLGKTIEFEKGKWVPVDDDLAEYLRANAIDNVTVKDGEENIGETRDKFEFTVMPVRETKRPVGDARAA